MLLKFGRHEREWLRLYLAHPPTTVAECETGVTYVEDCLERLCGIGSDDEQEFDDDMMLIMSVLKALKWRNLEIEVLAKQLYAIHPSLARPLLKPEYRLR
jgi:hypothetical protein